MYIEWVFLFNFLVNISLLKFVEAVTYSSIPRWRLVCSAGCSALFAVIFYSNAVMMGVCFVMLIGLAYSFRVRTLIRYGRTLIVATLLVGGILAALQPFLITYSIAIYILFSIGIVYSSLLLLKVSWLQKLQHLIQQRFVMPCTVLFDEQLWELVAYIDTGNECVEPISRSPVHFVAFEALQQQLPLPLKEGLLRWDEQEPYNLSMFASYHNKIRMVMLATIQQTTTVVPAFRVTLYMHEQKYCHHYIVFTKNANKFPQNVHMIAHVSVLTNS